MGTDVMLPQGTAPWFEMVGELMCKAASDYGLSLDLNVSMVERYTDAVAISDEIDQGLSFYIRGGAPSFKVGARRDEKVDISIEITSAAARTLNLLYSADPKFAAAVETFLSEGEMRVSGDPSRLGDWLSTVHDTIVNRTT